MRKHKQHILYIVIVAILLGLITINNGSNISALSYQSNVGVGFTFNPTLSVSISPSDLIISNLVPGNTLDGNVINVSVASNASYGYTLSAIVNGNNSNLTHTNGTNVFSSIATNADLSSLDNSEDANIWGYSYKDNTVVSPTWSNYSGLSNSTSKTLLDTNTNNIETGIDGIDFKIAAKASNAQPGGTYTSTINFTAVTKHIPVTLAEAYASEGKTMINGFYTMQDMTSTICSKVEAIGSQLQVLDKRDNKLYWIAKLADNHCWMTQNLELDLDSTATASSTNAFTSENTNLKAYDNNGYDSNNGYSCSNTQTTSNCTDTGEIITWVPARSTIVSINNTNFPNTPEADNTPYSYNPRDKYYYPTSISNDDTPYTIAECQARGYTDCTHYKAGNYYNWSASVASNNTSSYISNNTDADNSLCSKGWRLPKKSVNEFQKLVNAYNITATNALDLRKKPLYFVRSGFAAGGSLIVPSSRGLYWSSTVSSSDNAYDLYFFNNNLYPASNLNRRYGFPIRCVAE